ncbi:MAG: DUF1850 domain-containing protein [Aurantimonas endophytica]|uniref:DUF1850 domain-containing protein n=1 Tax=Aurantimonas endophytica TaxID=1522175 RepID=A0A7W6HH96_9HYPH|nr:DUF1850 domain-containing protein [Aurantimonas endophytica]MBB4005219.1 hypothetical protein [Aurantimonas endophytica]MCO6406118.1 DUF1850 domain-containing protein [Aurantimonas endophytica]
MICILAAGKTLTLAASAFALSWTHSVEKTRWEESWRAGPAGLTVVEGRIAGSGAGMEPPEGAVRDGNAYVYRPDVPAIPELVLAASGATGSGWTLCPAEAGSGSCLTLGAEQGPPILVRWCDLPLGTDRDPR